MQISRALTLALTLIILSSTPVSSQSVYGQRLVGRNNFVLPVASRLLSSDSVMHERRGSVLAWDINAPKHSPIYPIAAGMVIYAGCNNAGGYGCWTLISHGNGYRSIMGHMIPGSIVVKAGKQVDLNTVVGAVGWSGQTSFGPHVHLEIHHPAGRVGRIDPAAIWDINQMVRCDKCSSGDGPPVTPNGFTQLATSGGGSPIGVWWFAAGIAVTVAILQMVYSPNGWLAFSLWHGGGWALTILIIAAAPIFVARQPAATVAGVGGWQQAYKITMGSEGARCTHDPIRTMAGVTQGTYDAWRMSQGLGPADVCGNLTEAQRQAIFVQRYWLASGADRLPAALSLTHTDFAFNAGVGAAQGILAQCGTDVRCYNNQREIFYRNARGFNLYGAGWLNRLNRIRVLTEVR